MGGGIGGGGGGIGRGGFWGGGATVGAKTAKRSNVFVVDRSIFISIWDVFLT